MVHKAKYEIHVRYDRIKLSSVLKLTIIDLSLWLTET